MNTRSALIRPAALALLAAWLPIQSARSAAPAEVGRGRYLAIAGDCVSCHTAPGGKPFAGGLPIATGYGTIYSPNITPDKETGIGSWSADDFYSAMHNGRDDEGKHLYPAFPYTWFTKVTRADVDAIKAYLDSLPPVKQQNKPPQLSWFLRWRGLMAGWNLLNFHPGEYVPQADKSAQWNRGAYLVEGLGHCGDCHTGKKTFGGTETDHPLQGGEWQGWYAPSLGGDLRAGLGGWSAAEIVEYLKTGSNDKTATVGRMSEVVANSTSHMSDADLDAIAVYLKDLPASGRDEDRNVALSGAALARGQGLYIDQCAGCHMEDGAGQRGVFPPLKGSAIVQARDPMTAISIVLNGAKMVTTPTKPTGITMPPFAWKLSDAEIADVVNYVRNAIGNRAPLTDASTVAKLRKRGDESTAAR